MHAIESWQKRERTLPEYWTDIVHSKRNKTEYRKRPVELGREHKTIVMSCRTCGIRRLRDRQLSHGVSWQAPARCHDRPVGLTRPSTLRDVPPSKIRDRIPYTCTWLVLVLVAKRTFVGSKKAYDMHVLLAFRLTVCTYAFWYITEFNADHIN